MRKKYNSYLIAFVIYICSVPLNGIQVISNISPTFSNAKVSHAKKKGEKKKKRSSRNRLLFQNLKLSCSVGGTGIWWLTLHASKLTMDPRDQHLPTKRRLMSKQNRKMQHQQQNLQTKTKSHLHRSSPNKSKSLWVSNISFPLYWLDTFHTYHNITKNNVKTSFFAPINYPLQHNIVNASYPHVYNTEHGLDHMYTYYYIV